MAWKSGLLAGLLAFQVFGTVTWPSSYDELEDIMSMFLPHSQIMLTFLVLNQGFNARALSFLVTPCNFPGPPDKYLLLHLFEQPFTMSPPITLLKELVDWMLPWLSN